jgi:hypothetical protein
MSSSFIQSESTCITFPHPNEPHGTSGLQAAPEPVSSITSPSAIADDDPQDTQNTTIAHISTTTAPTASTYSAGSNFNSEASAPGHSYWSVEYNPEIEQNFSLQVADTFTFQDMVMCTNFSRDGKHLAIGLANGETHIYMT